MLLIRVMVRLKIAQRLEFVNPEVTGHLLSRLHGAIEDLVACILSRNDTDGI